MFCTRCGGQVNDGSRFCTNCGNSIAEGASPSDAAPTLVFERLPAQPSAEYGTPQQPAERAQAQQPAVYAPPPQPAEYLPEQPPQHTTGRNTASVVAWVLVGVLVVATIAVGVWGVASGRMKIGSLGATTTAADSGNRKGGSAQDSKDRNQDGDSADNEGGQGSSAGATEVDGLLGPDESYDVLVNHYDRLRRMNARVGLARKDGKYGGTGFAFDVFNKYIGAKSYSDRSDLIDRCVGLLDEVKSYRDGLAEANVDPDYSSQKKRLMDLYDLLIRRVEVMRDAAEVALDSPDRDSWGPVLQPASKNTRMEFDRKYELAEPYRY